VLQSPPDGDARAPAQWRRVEELYESAVRLEPAKRCAFLAEACPGDDRLRQEVESPLAAFEQARDFLDVPALEAMAASAASDEAPPGAEALPAGVQIGPYLILGALGRGGPDGWPQGPMALETHTAAARPWTARSASSRSPP